MEITKRDLELIAKLHSYGILATKQIDRLVFNTSYQVVMRRLTKLESYGYIRRTISGAFQEHVWWLTEKGAKLCSDRPPRWNISRFTLEHDLMVVDLRIILETCKIAKHWIPEHEIRTKVASRHGIRHAKHKVVPDGLMGVEMGAFKESIAIELELHSKSSHRYRNIFLDYQFKDNLHAVWYLASTQQLARNIEKQWYKTGYGNQKVRFYWSTASDVLKKGPQALIQRGDISKELHEVFLQNENVQGALTPAESISRVCDEKVKNISDVSIENQTTKVIEAS